tara:strand:- start:483 stop:1118 length:636 start_codon:yes stop_codon:yes gene_type:complete
MAWAQIAALAVQAVVAIGGAIGDKSRSNQARDRAEAAQEKLDQQTNMLNMLDTSNPYMNMENTLEDLTINQKQAEFERQSINQQQANIMDQLKQGAGSSGIAALAQTLAQQGQLAAQKSSADIGKQEAANNLAAAQQAGQIQSLERQGEMMSRQMEFGKLESQMALTMQNIAMEREMQYGNQVNAGSGFNQGAAVGGDLITELVSEGIINF